MRATAAHRSTAVQRAARLFWSVVGSSLLVVSGVLLGWFLGGRHDLPMAMRRACAMLLRQGWCLVEWQGRTPAFATLLGLVLIASGAGAGVRRLVAWDRTRRLLASSVPYRPEHWPALAGALATLPHGRPPPRVSWPAPWGSGATRFSCRLGCSRRCRRPKSGPW